MSRRIHRSGAPGDASSSSSSEEEDAFTALSRRKSKKRRVVAAEDACIAPESSQVETTGGHTAAVVLARQDASAARKQKLDALVEELLETSQSIPLDATAKGERRAAVRGSFVLPGEEHLTTNVFVGNLPPSITEEEVGQLFSQFGELYSVKIMYPRTAEERARDRHSGFVCFWNRQDAQDALTACNDRDVFGKGRRVHMNWGRKVELKGTPKVTGVTTTKSLNDVDTSGFHPQLHGAAAIRIQLPTSPRRLQFISTVASFIAKDGTQLEEELFQSLHSKQVPDLDFLRYQSHTKTDHLFYKWRVYSFAQGDTWNVWRTEPFQMIRDGCFWIPPPLQEDAVRREREGKQAEQLERDRQKQQRRMISIKQDILTGRQMENLYKNKLGELSQEDAMELDRLIREELCGSRQSILKVMAFCFEKSTAADQVSNILKDRLLETNHDVEEVVARLFLLSDILFNSQQPGVKNAFRYRDAIERMAPSVFTGLHQYGLSLGRMTLNKLARAVRNVLEAWRSWDVFHAAFLDELHVCFNGAAASEDAAKGLPVRVQAAAVGTNKAEALESHDNVNEDSTTRLAHPRVPSGQRFEEVGDNDDEDDEDDVDGEPMASDEESNSGVVARDNFHQADACGNESDSQDGEPFDDDDL